ncbi:MAG: CDP-diacylglycerol--glycerol-3-phosphate 3-phosphatidyltransferase [Syntrophomonadaceae bacterium]|nr:CDP-diacylglycerol--glycerol-3-phosphate 3-phosphatidyltransferase [Syntrophomonadaceae bacterium]
MNLPNALTISRILLIPVFIIALLVDTPRYDLIALGVFLIASFTDTLDGYLARKLKQITKLGIILDPLADKILITAAMITFVELGRMSGWIAIVIIAREFAVTGLRAVKAEDGVIIAASNLGKLKTVTQIIACMLLIAPSLYQPYIAFPIGIWAMYLAVVITVLSGIEYFYKFNIIDK